MPRRRRIGRVSPIVGFGGMPLAQGGNLEPQRTLQAPYGSVAFLCNDPLLDVVASLNEDGAVPIEGGARFRMSERIGQKAVPEYEGHDPIRMEVSIVLDGWAQRRHVTHQMKDLQRLSQRNEDWKMPRIRLFGPVPHEALRWHIDGPLRWDTDPTPINTESGWYRLPMTITLIEAVEDKFLQTSIRRSRRGSGANNGPHFTHVRRGEHGFGDVSKRLYKTRSRAAELARANNMPIGKRLKVGEKLRKV